MKPKCKWCKDTGVVTVNFKTEPCLDCAPKTLDAGGYDVRVTGWIDGGDTGASSKTIWHILTKLPGKVHRYDVPHDADDFGRCARLLEHIPEWRARLVEMADRCSEWKAIVYNWDELVDLYALGASGRDRLNEFLRRIS